MSKKSINSMFLTKLYGKEAALTVSCQLYGK